VTSHLSTSNLTIATTHDERHNELRFAGT
jgi:hypothetical protein